MDWSSELLRYVLFENIEARVSLTRVSVEELGFPEGASTAEIYNAAKHVGLSTCPHEVAFQFWLQYPQALLNNPDDQVNWLIFGSDPIKFLDEDSLFGIHDDRWIVGEFAKPEDTWQGNQPFVFVG